MPAAATLARAPETRTSGGVGSDLAVLALSAGALAAVAAHQLGVLILAYGLVVPGLLTLQLLGDRLRLRPGVAPIVVLTVGYAAMTAVSTLSLWLHLWHPRWVTAAAALATAGYAARRLGRARGRLAETLDPAGWQLSTTRVLRSWAATPGPARIGAALLGLGAVAWVVSLPLIDTTGQGRPLGLLLDGPPAFAAALVLTTAAFLVAIRARSSGLAVAALAIAILIQRGTGALVLDAPAVDWAAKHLGVVALFAETGQVHERLDVYQGWPGFFATLAWAVGGGDLDVFRLACWFTLAITIASTLAVYALARSLRLPPLAGLMVAQLALSLNWVAQDYFSPQAVGYVLAMATFALLLSRSTAALVLAVITYCALLLTHQLTPFWVLGAMVVLCLMRRVPWPVPVICLVATGLQLWANLDVVAGFHLFTGLDIRKNAQTSTAFGTGSPELRLHSATNRTAAVTLWGLALLTVIASIRRLGVRRWWGHRDAAAAVIGFSPFAILATQDYGGEALLRVMLFSIPGCAVLVGRLLDRWLRADRLVPVVAAWVAAFAMTLCAAHAYFSTFYHYAVTAAEYRVAALLEADVPGQAYLSPASAYWPIRPTATYADRLVWSREYDNPVHNIGDWIGRPDYPAQLMDTLQWRKAPVYMIFNSRMDAYGDYRGVAPLGAIDATRELLMRRPEWEVLIDEDGVTVLRYIPPGTASQPAATWEP